MKLKAKLKERKPERTKPIAKLKERKPERTNLMSAFPTDQEVADYGR